MGDVVWLRTEGLVENTVNHPGLRNSLPPGSLDKTIQLWDLRTGLSSSCSRPHGGTVRCIAMDERVLVSGCADKSMRAWFPALSEDWDDGDLCFEEGRSPALFDLAAPHVSLPDHRGPVSSLCLTDSALYSGSWDCTVRTYSRHATDQLELSGEHTYSDCEWAVDN